MKVDQEKCFICGKALLYGGQPKATYHALLRIRYCMNDECGRVVMQCERDFSNSKRGRRRTKSEVLKEIERLKTHDSRDHL